MGDKLFDLRDAALTCKNCCLEFDISGDVCQISRMNSIHSHTKFAGSESTTADFVPVQAHILL